MKLKIMYLLIFVSSNLYAQKTLNIEQYNNHITNQIPIPFSVFRIIDSNNIFEPFIGTWSGTHDGLGYKFLISKVSESDEDFEDFEYMEIRYVVKQGAILLADTRQEESESISVFLDRMPNNLKADFFVTDDDKCNNDLVGTFKLIAQQSGALTRNPIYDKIEVTFYEEPSFLLENLCPNGSTSNRFPSKVLINLTKE